ncbi:MAG: MFS transporter [Ktedonobacteraceae bacterium]|nr:MFS transporter [Ktedonobacteraceae bacterium]
MSEIISSPGREATGSQRISASYARYIFLVLFSVSVLNYLDRFVLSGAANQIARDLHFDLRGVGLLSSAFLIVYTLATLPLGMWADRTKRKNVVALCVAVWSVATAATALATNFLTLFIARMILGIGEAGYLPAGAALLSDYFDSKKRNRVLSFWNSSQMFGVLGGFAIGGVIAGISTGSWRWAFLISGIPGLFLAFLAWRMREPRRNQADEEAGEIEIISSQGNEESTTAAQVVATTRSRLGQVLGLFRIKTVVVLLIMQSLILFVLGANVALLPIYLQQKDLFGMTPGVAGIYSGVVIVVAGFVGTLLGGYLADIIGRRYAGARVLVCGIGFLLGAPAYALAFIYHDIVVFTISFFLAILLLSLYNGPGMAAGLGVVPSVLRASAVGLSVLIAHLLGDVSSPSLVGFIATALDPTQGQHFAADMAGQDLSIALLITVSLFLPAGRCFWITLAGGRYCCCRAS